MTQHNTNVSRVARALLCMQRYSWEQGVTMQAFYEMGEMEIVTALAREACYRAAADGRAATIGVPEAVTDPCSVGQALLAAAHFANDAVLQSGADALLEWALHKAPRNAHGAVYHMDTSKQFWSDSFYMLPPYLAAAGQYEAALANVYGYWQALYDEQSGLVCHMWDDAAGAYVRAAHWGTGNGWAMAGLARVIDLLPPEYAKDRAKLVSMAQALVDKVLSFRRPDGAYHDIIDDDSSFAEYNLSQMVAYTLYRGMCSGWLEETYLPVAEALRRAVGKQVDACGFVQNVCGAPTFDKPGVSPEAQAFYLLMENAAALFDKKQFANNKSKEEK